MHKKMKFHHWVGCRQVSNEIFTCIIYLVHINFPFPVVTDEDETFAWVKGVRFLIEEEKNAPYPLQIERWLRKEFYAIENNHKK